MCHITSLLINDGQGYHLAKVQADYAKSPHHLYLRDIVIHSAVVFTHKQREAFLQLFVNLLYRPSTVKVLLLYGIWSTLKSILYYEQITFISYSVYIIM